jgi:hypothetical protein
VAKLPDPPTSDDLKTVPTDEQVVAAGSWLWRIYFRGGDHPTAWSEFRAFGPTSSRFDHHDPPPAVQARSILYGGLDPHGIRTAVAEVFQQTRTVDRKRNDPWLVGFITTRDVTLLDLTGVWPTRAGASQAISTGPRRRAREWSRRIYEAYPTLEGLLYRSSMSSDHAVALYDRGASLIPAAPQFHRALIDPVLTAPLLQVCDEIGYVIAMP